MEISNEQRSPARRYVEVGIFVVAWMICGWAASLGTDAYLLLGVPLALLFQRLVARRPLAALWVRASDRVNLRRRDIAIAGLVLVLPAWTLVTEAIPERQWVIALWMTCAVFGAFGVAFAIREQQSHALRRALPYAVAAMLWQCGLFALGALARSRSAVPDLMHILPFFRHFLLYLPVGFVLEEVVFRGALDSHLAATETARTKSWVSAIFVSVLWGLWHLPMLPGTPSFGAVVGSAFVLVPLGVLLSFTWRTGGTLLLPAIVHAAVDAYRNVLQG